MGLFKKVVIADSLSYWVDMAFEQAESLSVIESWVASFSFTLQMYYDFSGYADMAVGLGLMFGISMPWNFNSPYQAKSIIDYWSRWHISLTSFITAYVYAPILRSLPGGITFANSMLATVIAMLISGLWHGSSWTFVLWGGLHGLALMINHCWRKTKVKLPIFLSWLLTFLFVNATLVVFRSQNVDQMISFFNAMTGGASSAGVGLISMQNPRWEWLGWSGGSYQLIVGVCLLMISILFFKNSSSLEIRFKNTPAFFFAQLLLLIFSLLMINSSGAFIYFQF